MVYTGCAGSSWDPDAVGAATEGCGAGRAGEGGPRAEGMGDSATGVLAPPRLFCALCFGQATELLRVLPVTQGGFSEKSPFLHTQASHSALSQDPRAPSPVPQLVTHPSVQRSPREHPSRWAEGGRHQAGLRAHGRRPVLTEGSGTLPLKFCSHSTGCGKTQQTSICCQKSK